MLLLRRRAGAIVSTGEVVEWLYGDDLMGGPDNPARCVYTTVYRLRRRGIDIRTHGERGYMLQKTG